MTGTCPPCAKDDHEHHTGYYDVKIHRKGHPLPGRKVECGCPVCIRRAAWPTDTQQRVFSYRAMMLHPEYTGNPCEICHHPSHWKQLVNGRTDEEGVCHGCPRCKGVAQ
jgi:hypothetical protein